MSRVVALGQAAADLAADIASGHKPEGEPTGHGHAYYAALRAADAKWVRGLHRASSLSIERSK